MRIKQLSHSQSESSPLGRRGWERKPTVFFPKRKSFNFFDNGGGFLRGEREGEPQQFPSLSPLKPPLEVLETFGGAKVSDDDQL
jgi:hypothetical protein